MYEFELFIKEFVIEDLDSRLVFKQILNLKKNNNFDKDDNILFEGNDYWNYLMGGESWDGSKGNI